MILNLSILYEISLEFVVKLFGIGFCVANYFKLKEDISIVLHVFVRYENF